MPSTLLFCDLDMREPEVHPLAGGEVGVFSARRPGKATANEDAAAILHVDEERGLLAVADGMGGGPAGERASACAVQALARAAAAGTVAQRSLRDVILNGMEAANRSVVELAIGSATTLVVLEIDGMCLRTYHVGDSAMLQVGQRGRRKHMTVSHSPTGYALEAGLISEEEALVHRDRHVVSNVIGSLDMKIEIGPSLTLAPLDTVLLASDGVLDNLRVQEITDIIRRGPLTDAVAKLAHAVRERMTVRSSGHPAKPDDYTFLVYRPRRRRRPSRAT